MYDTAHIIATINDNLAFFLVFGLIGMAGNWWYFYEAIVMGFRHRTYAVAATCTLFFFAHDIAFIAAWYVWFVELDFWMWKLFWINILISGVGEIVIFYQMVKYGRDELLPGFSRRALIAGLIGAQICIVIAFWYARSALGDPMFLISIPLTIFWLAPWAIALTLRRQSTRGQSVKLNLSYIMMVAGIWPAWSILDPMFQSPLFFALGAASISWALANIWVLRRVPRYQPAAA